MHIVIAKDYEDMSDTNYQVVVGTVADPLATYINKAMRM